MNGILILLTLSECILALEIQNNNADQGFNFLRNGEINVLHHFEYVYITFDIPSVEYLLNNYQKIDLNCSNGEHLFKTDNITWHFPTSEPDIDESVVHRYRIKIAYNQLIESDINTLENENLSQPQQCYLLDQIISNFTLINRELNKLADLDTSSINEIITFRQLAGYIGNFKQRRDIAYLLPFSLQKMNEKVFNYIEFDFFQMDYKVTLSFKIPLYKTHNVYNVIKKPIIYDNNQFIFHSVRDLAIFNGTKPVFFSEETINSKCRKQNGLFCENLKQHNACENDVSNKQPIHRDCLTKIDNINSIARVRNDIYLILFTPMVIDFKCESLSGTYQYSIKISTNVLIRGNTYCSLNTTDFYYNPHTNQEASDLFFPSKNLIPWEIMITDQTILIVESIELSLLGCAGIIVVFLCIKIKRTTNKLKNINLESEGTSSIHMYATIL